MNATESKLIRYVCHQLESRGIERTPDQVYWAVYNDVDRNETLATEALRELAINQEALRRFADSLAEVRPPLVIHTYDPTLLFMAMSFGGAMLFVCGYLLGASL